MKKIGIVTKREYLRRVNKKSFIIITLLVPVLSVAMVFIPLWLSSVKSKSSEAYEVMVADRTGKYVSLFKDTERFRFVGTDKEQAPVDELRKGRSGVFAFLEITDDLLKNPKAVTLYSEKQIPEDLKREVTRTLRQYLEDEKRASFNIPDLDRIIKESRVHIEVPTIKWGKDGTATESSSHMVSAIGMIFVFVIYMFIMMYGAMVMQGVMEEKTNRIVEVMVSSVRPFELMMGKIVGIGLVGLTQFLIWCILTVVFLAVGGLFLAGAGGGINIQASMLSAAEAAPIVRMISQLGSINFVEITVYFVLFFIGGFLSYASLFAAVGSAVDSPEDSQQFIMPLTIFLIFALYTSIYSVNNPDGPFAFWCSLIPFTSSIVMMMRIPYGIPFWQILLSLVLLYTSAVFLIWLSARIYRVGILMYGKKPSFKELARWIRY
jgi:ABC-2 type transport system permease protein